MADTKISDLTALTSLDPGDLFVVVDDPAGTPLTRKITGTNVKAGLSLDNVENTALTTWAGSSSIVTVGTILGTLAVDQANATGAIPVVSFDQGDASEPFVDFIGTSAADAANSISTLTTSGSTTHHIQVDINGVKAWIAASTTDPT